MLILTRKPDQGLLMYSGDGKYVGRIFILGIERDRVKLGLDVDKRFIVLRDELVSGDPSAGLEM